MANTIKPKRSNTASKVPNTSELVSGELGVNMADKKIYINNGTAVVQVGAGLLSALGDVTITSPTNGQSLSYNGTAWVNATGAGSGTVTSVSATVPTGLSIAGSPITTSGTLAITYTAGYAIPTTASQTNWDSAYTQRLQWDGGSTNLVAATGRTSLGATTVGGNFFTLTNPAAITFPRMNADNTVSALDAATFRTAIGAGTGSGTVTGVTATSPVASSGGTAPVISMPAATTSVSGYLTSTDWNTFNGKYSVGGALGTPSSGTLTNCTFPTLNQNTTGSSGSCTGNAATASNASLLNSISAINLYNNMGDIHATRSAFDATGVALTSGFGYRYVQGNTNSPNTNSATQYYAWNIGLGSDYAFNSYAAQFALPRNVTTPYLSVRYEEAGVLGAWQKISAGLADTANGVAAGVVTGRMIYNSFTATAAQTTFTPTNTYTSGKIEVYANGIKMVNGSDVTVTSGTSVVFATGVAVNTRVDLVYPI
jgi:hypothetical protein